MQRRTRVLTCRRAQLSAAEQTAALSAFNDAGRTQASGIRLAGQKYFTLQANERSVYGKKGVRDLLPRPAPSPLILHLDFARRCRPMGACS